MSPLTARIPALLAVGLIATTPACQRATKEEAKKQKKADQAESARATRASLLRFANAIREILVWKAAQPAPGSEAAQRRILDELSAKMHAVPVKNLPEDVGEPWGQLLPAYRALANTPSMDPQLRDQASQAAARLNKALADHGIIDLHL